MSESEYSLEGQENVIEALESGNLIRLWRELRYVGYNKVHSPRERELIMVHAYDTWDREKNTSFLAYYTLMLNYAAMNKYKDSTNLLRISKRALKRLNDQADWPTREGLTVRNQSENICSTFTFARG